MIQQPAVNSKVNAFRHSKLAGVHILKCTYKVDFERSFQPSIIRRDVLSFNDDKECVHCHNDTHVPKLYSFDNNMDPGLIPLALLMIFMEFPPYFLISN